MSKDSVQEGINDSESCQSPLLEKCDKPWCEVKSHRRQWMHWAVHVVLAVALGTSIFLQYISRSNPVERFSSVQDVRPDEAFWDASHTLAQTSPRRYEIWRHNTTASHWKGAPNPENTLLWESLVSVGYISTTSHEYTRLGFPTARNIQNPTEYVLTPQVYHDLHCMHMIRLFFWRAVNGTLVHDSNLDLNIPHFDHCIDTLRQSLMCYADLSPLQWHWNHHKQCYEPTWDVPRQCRNFDAVQEWATERNTTGMVPITRPEKEEVEVRLRELERLGEKMPWDP